jgi:excisionase family DNA binding protein
MDAALARHLRVSRTEPNPPEIDFDSAVQSAVAARIEELREQVDVVLIDEASEIAGVSKPKLYEMRRNGVGPASRRWGRLIGYRREDLEAWMRYRAAGAMKGVPPDIDLDSL